MCRLAPAGVVLPDRDPSCAVTGSVPLATTVYTPPVVTRPRIGNPVFQNTASATSALVPSV